MVRLPAIMLESTVTIERLGGNSGRGQTYAEPVTRRAHVEETVKLVVDERPDSGTRGSEVAASVMILTQLADYAEPGSMIVVRGERRQVVQARRFDNPHAPESAEHWAV